MACYRFACSDMTFRLQSNLLAWRELFRRVEARELEVENEMAALNPSQRDHKLGECECFESSSDSPHAAPKAGDRLLVGPRSSTWLENWGEMHTESCGVESRHCGDSRPDRVADSEGAARMPETVRRLYQAALFVGSYASCGPGALRSMNLIGGPRRESQNMARPVQRSARTPRSKPAVSCSCVQIPRACQTPSRKESMSAARPFHRSAALRFKPTVLRSSAGIHMLPEVREGSSQAQPGLTVTEICAGKRLESTD
ncbi:uncharacterized protein MYCFIDRAFT_174467 [Pseudocercospora fijiensis CIRAD86]|uniref:Uncharacterized protein n=1 Tax=Pseudocercospora fijiensis (strain CIRAD86) TaxID=383855 RepID=M3AEF1_PSEFD|nr:uncharacterized protein MYCFIDRAFT_174467 [Pseudocercospora fijiensis CIRAD86]EME82966.1 hypothetical protein MYCFIDRAFT_174467 [Pseudocercospora fijiensis CIRAD86]